MRSRLRCTRSSLSLTKQVARDGEGATKLIEVCVDGAASAAQAKRVAKAIVNSPLVKTAVHGADPNWGRVAMAVGKATTAAEIDQSQVTIRFGAQEVYPSAADLTALTDYMRGDEVRIHVSLAAGQESATVWGCDLSDGYVRINADYTTCSRAVGQSGEPDHHFGCMRMPPSTRMVSAFM